jgi:hypothetical protein
VVLVRSLEDVHEIRTEMADHVSLSVHCQYDSTQEALDAFELSSIGL